LAVAGATVAHLLGVFLDGLVPIGQATALALASLAVLVLISAGRGRFAMAGGIAVLALDAATATDEDDGGRFLAPFYAPLTSPPYSFTDDLAWLGDSLAAQLVGAWPALLGIMLICAGAIATLTGQPREGTPRRQWISWLAGTLTAVALLADLHGGPPARQLVTLGVMLPTIAVLAAALAMLSVAVVRQLRVAVPAGLGALLLVFAAFSADLAQLGPARPFFLEQASSAPESFLEMGVRTEVAAAVAVGPGSSPGFVTSPLLALLPVLALVLLALATTRRNAAAVTSPAP
jgi:hypothetical protein